MVKKFVEDEQYYEAIIAFVKNETELFEVIESEADGLIVVDGKIEISPGKCIELKEGQRLVGGMYVGRENEAELVFCQTGAEPIICLAEKSMLIALNIKVENCNLPEGGCLLELKDVSDAKFKNICLEVIPPLNNAVLVQLSGDSLLDCENNLKLKVIGNQISAFDVADDSRLNLRGSLQLNCRGYGNYGLVISDDAGVNIFSDACIEVNFQSQKNCHHNRGILLSEGNVNIFGGAKFTLKGGKFFENKVENHGCLFVYKGAEITAYSSCSDNPQIWKCQRFWREKRQVEIIGFEDYQDDFLMVKPA